MNVNGHVFIAENVALLQGGGGNSIDSNVEPIE
jgi:hypothetical protein